MRRHPALVSVLLVLLLPAIVGTPRAIAVERPPRLAPSGCELWIGRGSGNDPSMQIELRLCPQPDGRVSGEVQWSSTTSGWNLRDVSGYYEAGDRRLILRDDRITAQRPEPGWRFCTIDRYTLERAGDRLSGPYHSSACSDDGTLALDRVANAAAQPGPAPPSPPGNTSDTPSPAPNTPPPAPPPRTPPPPPPSRGPFGCSL